VQAEAETTTSCDSSFPRIAPDAGAAVDETLGFLPNRAAQQLAEAVCIDPEKLVHKLRLQQTLFALAQAMLGNAAHQRHSFLETFAKRLR
jgi:hypothetical protein